MKATVEEATEFVEILNIITNSNNENQLRVSMSFHSPEIKHFVYGFGKNHLWVIRKGGNGERLIFVEF